MPRTSSSGSFDGVYAIGQSSAAVSEETSYVGAVMVFQQTTAPTGWTKITTYDDYMLTQTSGSVVANSTSRFGFSARMTLKNQPITATSAGPISVGPATLSMTQIQPHTHQYTGYASINFRPGTAGHLQLGASGGNAPSNTGAWSAPIRLDAHPGGAAAAHTHPYQTSPYTGPPAPFSKDMRVKYVDSILASRN